jgi:hypothetical protein
MKFANRRRVISLLVLVFRRGGVLSSETEIILGEVEHTDDLIPLNLRFAADVTVVRVEHCVSMAAVDYSIVDY